MQLIVLQMRSALTSVCQRCPLGENAILLRNPRPRPQGFIFVVTTWSSAAGSLGGVYTAVGNVTRAWFCCFPWSAHILVNAHMADFVCLSWQITNKAPEFNVMAADSWWMSTDGNAQLLVGWITLSVSCCCCVSVLSQCCFGAVVVGNSTTYELWYIVNMCWLMFSV